jgi:2'-5' RNA ligase
MAQMTFLARVYAKLRERLSDGGFLSADEFAELWKQARSHAGGKARAEAAQAAEGDHTGCIVCLVPDPDTAQALAVDGGLAPEQLHLTLCLFGDTELLGPIARAEALLAVRDAAACCAPLAGEISGIGRFTNGEQDVIYASLDSPALSELREHVCDALEAVGLELAEDHGFTPHITLTMVESGMPSPIEIIEARPVRFDALGVWFGPEHLSVPLLGMGEEDEAGAAELMAALGATPDGTPLPDAALGIKHNRTEPEDAFELMASDSVFCTSPVPSDLADLAAAGHTHRLFHTIAFAEAPEWIPFLPKPGTYAHPRYGDITITRERNARFVKNYKDGVYQDRLPIDAEHETKLSGAVGWVADMRQNADGSADAKAEWTDRGRAFFQADRFRYFSPEWYDVWEDPATRIQHRDVAIGGALTTRPFFKAPALRPLFASEGSLRIDDSVQGDTMDAQQFAELETKFKALEAENAALKSASETTAASNKQLAEQMAAMQADARTQRYTALIRGLGDSAHPHRWFGEVANHVEVLNTFAQTFGEDSPQFKAYVTQQQAVAAQIATSEAFRELGSDASGRPESAWAQIERKASELRAAEPTLSIEQATAKALEQNPALYRQYQAEAA